MFQVNPKQFALHKLVAAEEIGDRRHSSAKGVPGSGGGQCQEDAALSIPLLTVKENRSKQ